MWWNTKISPVVPVLMLFVVEFILLIYFLATKFVQPPAIVQVLSALNLPDIDGN